jgi:hypothetical protein
MLLNTNGNNVLHQLARAMAAGGHPSTALALRKLAHTGYSTLDQVENTPDWILLAIPGIGVGRLGEVRRLTRPDWQPPLPQAIQAGSWFLSAAQFALRYWPLEILVSLVRGSTPPQVSGGAIERRIALDVFSKAAWKAQRYCDADELVQALWSAPALENERIDRCAPAVRFILPDKTEGTQDSDRYAHSRLKRLEIVQHYWVAREREEVQNKDAWARARYHISGKTLLCYEREFENQKQAILAGADSVRDP